MTDKTLGEMLEELRSIKDVSLQTVANAVGASKPHIHDLEKGNSTNPGLELMKALAKYYGVTVGYLAGEEGSLSENVNQLKNDLDEADRRAGAAERENARLKESAIRRSEWLRKAKAEAGYDDTVSFGEVWAEALSALRQIRREA